MDQRRIRLLFQPLLSVALSNCQELERPASEAENPAAGWEMASPLDPEVSPAGLPVESLSPESVAGRSVVMEFWATWCAPCVQAIPHWNELAVELVGEPILFLSVSDEEPERVRRFLEDRPFEGTVLLDRDRSMCDAYGVRGVPHTVLIDSEGRIRAVTNPSEIEVEHLRALLAGKTPQVDERERFHEPSTGDWPRPQAPTLSFGPPCIRPPRTTR